MGLEAATTINQLVETNPLGTDTRAQGDDHIRLIKATLKNTFPNVTAPVTVNQNQINSIAVPGVLCFPGMIIMWSGPLGQVPGGWQLCNGTGFTSLGVAIPDLRSRFIVGSGGDSGNLYNTRDIGGSTSHTHPITVAGTVLTVAQIPAHTHGATMGLTDIDTGNFGGGRSNAYGTQYTQSTGGGQPHDHTATAGVAEHRPPFFALAFLIKI